MRILIVEDDPLTALVIQQTVMDLGFEPVMAFSIAEAIAWLTGAGVHAAVLDIGLPDGQSFAIARALKSERLPFVFATGQFFDKEGGFADVEIVEKPFDRARLKVAIHRLFKASQPSSRTTHPWTSEAANSVAS